MAAWEMPVPVAAGLPADEHSGRLAGAAGASWLTSVRGSISTNPLKETSHDD